MMNATNSKAIRGLGLDPAALDWLQGRGAKAVEDAVYSLDISTASLLWMHLARGMRLEDVDSELGLRACDLDVNEELEGGSLALLRVLQREGWPVQSAEDAASLVKIVGYLTGLRDSLLPVVSEPDSWSEISLPTEIRVLNGEQRVLAHLVRSHRQGIPSGGQQFEPEGGMSFRDLWRLLRQPVLIDFDGHRVPVDSSTFEVPQYDDEAGTLGFSTSDSGQAVDPYVLALTAVLGGRRVEVWKRGHRAVLVVATSTQGDVG